MSILNGLTFSLTITLFSELSNEDLEQSFQDNFNVSLDSSGQLNLTLMAENIADEMDIYDNEDNIPEALFEDVLEYAQVMFPTFLV